jgi:hypothetical protein
MSSLQICDITIDDLAVDCEANALDLIRFKADFCGLNRHFGSAFDDGGLISVDKKLLDVRGILRWTSEVTSDSSQNPANDLIPSSVSSPSQSPLADSASSASPSPSSSLSASLSPSPSLLPVRSADPIGVVGTSGSDVIYMFQYEEEVFQLTIPVDGTALKAKELIAIRYQTIAEYVSLLFCGRNLKDECVLSRQRIGSGKIIVYIRSLDAIMLQSLSFGSRRSAVKPADFVERVNLLQQKSGKDARTCSRCDQFYDYNSERTLAALQDDLDD